MRMFGAIAVTASLLASGAAYAGTPGWTVSERSGAVSILSTGVAKAALRGGSIAAGDFVTTGANGRAVLVRGEEYLVVSPNSRIRVADPAKSGGLTQIVEHFGNVIYKIKKMTMPHFAVETPFLAAVVKGTTFSVTVTDKGASVQVVEGRVEVLTRDGGASYMALPGDIGSVSAKALGNLNIQGRENRVITSPLPAETAPRADAVTASLGEGVVPTVDTSAPTVVATTISEGPVSLDKVSDGMVGGDSSLTAIVAVAAPANQAAQTPPVTLAFNDVPVPPVPATATPEVVTVAPAPTPAAVVIAPGAPSPISGAPEPVSPGLGAPVSVVPAPVVTSPAAPAPTSPALTPIVASPVASAPVGIDPGAIITEPAVTAPSAPVANGGNGSANAPATAPVTAPAAGNSGNGNGNGSGSANAPATSPVTAPVTAPANGYAGNYTDLLKDLADKVRAYVDKIRN